jgi:hypothetical protein
MGCCANIKVNQSVRIVKQITSDDLSQITSVHGKSTQNLFVESNKEIPFAAKFVEIRPGIKIVVHEEPLEKKESEIVIQEYPESFPNRLTIDISHHFSSTGRLETHENDSNISGPPTTCPTTKSRRIPSHIIPSDMLSPTELSKSADLNASISSDPGHFSHSIRLNPIGAANFEFDVCILPDENDGIKLPKIKPGYRKYNKNIEEINRLLEELAL